MQYPINTAAMAYVCFFQTPFL